MIVSHANAKGFTDFDVAWDSETLNVRKKEKNSSQKVIRLLISNTS